MRIASQNNTARGAMITLIVLLNGIILKLAITGSPAWYRLLWINIPVLLLLLMMQLKRYNRTTSHITRLYFLETDKLTINSNIQTDAMEITEKLPVLKQDDYDIIMSYLKTGESRTLFNRHDVEDLRNELQRAKVVPQNEFFPPDVVGLNSLVSFKDEKGKTFQLTVVTPKLADIKSGKVSVMSPIGRALIGYRKGQTVSWKVPSGEKTFTILNVIKG